MIKISKGLDLPISGSPSLEKISMGNEVKTCALTGSDFPMMKPTMKVNVGDGVKLGQVLFEDKKSEGIFYTSPAAGTIEAINRGKKRVFESIVIKIDESFGEVEYPHYKGSMLKDYSKDDIRSLLIESGLWVSLRQRPYSRVAQINDTPHSIFINAVDTNPFAPSPEACLAGEQDTTDLAISFLNELTNGKIHLCKKMGSSITSHHDFVVTHEFTGKHPAGNVGTHIHFIDPIQNGKIVWHLGYQDLLAIGKFLESGKLYTKRVVSIAGPAAKSPRFVRTRLGACLSELIQGELTSDNSRIISGSILNGRTQTQSFDFLGRYHRQVTLLEDNFEREFIGWMKPGANKFSISRAFTSSLLGKKLFNMNTSQNGSPRAMVPIGLFEKVMPMDILPTQLFRAMLSGNNEMAQKLGILELDEEDLALCSFVDPCKHDFGAVLRERLTIIEKEG